MKVRDFTKNQRQAMLKAIDDRADIWDTVDPDTEIMSIGEGVGLGEAETFTLFKRLVDEHCVDPGRVISPVGAPRGRTNRVVGRNEVLIPIGDGVRLTDKGRAELE